MILSWASVLGRACCGSFSRGTEGECVPADSPGEVRASVGPDLRRLFLKLSALSCPALLE